MEQVDYDGLEKYIQAHLALLPESSIFTGPDATIRAASLLKAVAFLSAFRRNLMDNKVRGTTINTTIYNKVYSETKFPEKIGVNEKKAQVEANPEYLKNSEEIEILENNIKYISSIIEVMNNGHLLLRQMAKD